MPARQFFEDFGLYRKFYIESGASLTLGSIPCPAIQCYCTRCKGERTWNEVREHRHRLGIGMSSSGSIEGLLNQKQPVLGSLISIAYYCSDCSRQSTKYIVLFGQDEPPEAEQLNQMLLSASRKFAMKVGQYPAWSIAPPKELRPMLGKYLDLYKRGSICESQGYGIGAFSYYRRIVENIIDELLNEVAGLLEPEEQCKYREALSQVGASKNATDKIEVVKELLPGSLRPGGVNPLQLLHSALSVGIHAAEEDDCLALGEGIRQSLVMLCKHVALAKQDRSDFVAGIQSVRQRLDQIARKQNQRSDDGEQERKG